MFWSKKNNPSKPLSVQILLVCILPTYLSLAKLSYKQHVLMTFIENTTQQNSLYINTIYPTITHEPLQSRCTCRCSRAPSRWALINFLSLVVLTGTWALWPLSETCHTSGHSTASWIYQGLWLLWWSFRSEAAVYNGTEGLQRYRKTNMSDSFLSSPSVSSSGGLCLSMCAVYGFM